MNSTERSGDDGFSLIEMMIVVALILVITVMALPSVSSYFKVSLNSAIREMASVVHETYNSAVITGRVHRLAYNFKEGTFWAEVGTATALLDTAETLEREERKKKFSKEPEKKDTGFSLAQSVTRKKISLPGGVVFEDIITEQAKDPVTEGTVYTHFFPSGLTEQTVIHLKDNSDHHVSLAISAIAGKTKLIGRYADKNEALTE